MQLSQSYAQPSQSKVDDQGMKFDFSAELSRPPVSLRAQVKNSLGYARLMLALHEVVKGDWRPVQKDHSAYQDWLAERYLEELPDHLKGVEVEKIRLLEKREKLKIQENKLRKEIQPLQKEVSKSRQNYYQWLYKNDRDKWMVLDPVISVHPDAVIFEAFSLDESSYGRLSVPSSLLDIQDKIRYGTTNIDFSQALADEVYRVRSYRPAWLNIAYDEVSIGTSVGTKLEKKIDLPPSWVRGFLQVQSASTIEGVDLSMDAYTLGQVLYFLERNKERESPRSLRFILEKGAKLKVVIDPWGQVVEDSQVYQGDFEGEIRIWGRRRLFVLKELLPYAEKVQLKLLGTGMPSYWSITLEGHRFDLGLSGWTANDWAKRGNFDLLASSGKSNAQNSKKIESLLVQKLALNSLEAAEKLGISRSDATQALQDLASDGQAMYDHLTNQYRWRQLLPKSLKLEENEEDQRLKYALSLIRSGKVSKQEESSLDGQLKEYKLQVEAKNTYQPEIHVDLDGRIKYADCKCSFHRRNKLRQGPCAHIMAAAVYINQS